MKTRSQTKREREGSPPVLRLDSAGMGPGMSRRKIGVPSVRTSNTNFGLQKYELQGQQLLPGISNDITLDLIIPKLPWITFQILPSVSRSWRQAIQSREVYNARCRAHVTETLILISPLICVNDGDVHYGPSWIGLYSMREEKVYRLPKILHGRGRGIPAACQSISLDGKVYVLGGRSAGGTPRSSMYVLDLAASKGWKRCASMKDGRRGFGCGIVDGKIFACGGIGSGDRTIVGAEIYDPELDRWSSLKPMTSMRRYNQLAVLGDEVLVHSGFVYGSRGNEAWPLDKNFPEIYNPTLDKWRRVEDSMGNDDGKRLFVTEGKIHSICTPGTEGVQVYDLDKKSWTDIHKLGLLEVPGECVKDLIIPLIVDSEIVRLIARHIPNHFSVWASFIRSSGFSDKRKILEWKSATTPFLVERGQWDHFKTGSMSIIQL